MYSVKNSVVQSFIQENYPNARLASWDDPDSDLAFYTADQLQEVTGDWFPLCCYKDKESQRVVYGGRGGVVHTYTEGETGAGKTSRFAMQSVRALSCLKEKPSFVVVDIHGELVENLYAHLRENGYEIKVLNCDDPDHSDTYNPFAPLVKRSLQSGTLDNEVINGIRKISEIIQPVVTHQDPIWEQGARSYTNGCILDKFEDLLQGNIPPQCITLYNIIESHYWIRNQITSHMGGLMTIDHYKEKGSQALSVQKMLSVTNNAEKTRASYFGVIENHYDAFGQPSLYQLSSNSTIDIDRFIDHPTAIFIQSGSTKIGDDLISMLVNEIYTTAVIRGKTTARKMLPRKIHCFLDEFANSNIAAGPEFIKMLTTSRKFGMFWHLFVQCDAQLDTKFDANIARIIRANCTEIFMGSNEYETMVRFARSCGQKTVESLGSLVTQGAPSLETVDLISADKLSLTEYGHVYIKSTRHPLLHSYIEAFYRCPEFVPVEDLQSIYPKNNFDYKQTVFFPDDILPPLSALECRILLHLYQEGSADRAALQKRFADQKIDAVIEQLIEDELIAENTKQDRVLSQISKQQCALLRFWQETGRYREPTEEEHRQQTADTACDETQQDDGTKKISLKEALDQLTCLPADLAAALRRRCAGVPLTVEEKEEWVSPMLHFSLVEAFIQNHDYKEKAEWVKGFQREYDIIRSVKYLPQQVLDSFATALREITHDLTLENIQQIKRFVS